MTLFFFDIRDNGELRRDRTGREMVNIDAAIEYARERYGKELSGPGELGQESAFRVEIRPDGDEVVAFVLDAETASA